MSESKLDKNFGKNADPAKPFVALRTKAEDALLLEHSLRLGLDPAYAKFPNLELGDGYILAPKTFPENTCYRLAGNLEDKQAVDHVIKVAREQYGIVIGANEDKTRYIAMVENVEMALQKCAYVKISDHTIRLREGAVFVPNPERVSSSVDTPRF